MKHPASATALAALVFLAACGSNPRQDAAPNASGAPAAQAKPPEATAPAVVPVQPVSVPAASTKRVVLNMTGPKTVTEAKDWASFKEEWRSTFSDYAKETGIVFSIQDGDAKPTGQPGTLLNVYVNDYRQIGIGARIFLGIMTGNAYIDAKVTYTDLNSGARFGEQSYNTSSSAWSGVFGKMTPQQVDAIGSQVFANFKAR